MTTLDFEFEGREYSLGFTIDVLKGLDRTGQLSKFISGDRPLTMTEDLFLAAFEAKHSAIPNNTRRRIFSEFSETSEDGSLLEVLAEMVNEVREAMTPKGNVQWRVTRKN